jgi:hypothetical protein
MHRFIFFKSHLFISFIIIYIQPPPPQCVWVRMDEGETCTAAFYVPPLLTFTPLLFSFIIIYIQPPPSQCVWVRMDEGDDSQEVQKAVMALLWHVLPAWGHRDLDKVQASGMIFYRKVAYNSMHHKVFLAS